MPDETPEETPDETDAEAEIVRMMQEETDEGDGAVAPFVSQLPGIPETAEGIDRLAEFDVEVTVELGENQIPIQEILAWGRDSVVELSAEEHQPVDVLVNGKLFARGEVVVVGDTFGVRILELVNQPDGPAL